MASKIPPRTDKPPKLKSVSYYKKKLWKLISLFVRRRDADENGMVACCTCGKIKHYKEGDAGHFIDGRHNAIVYDIRQIHFQCKPCNGGFINNKDINGFELDAREVKKRYEAYMVKRYGQAVVDELKAADKKRKEFTRQELIKEIEHYTQLLKTL